MLVISTWLWGEKYSPLDVVKLRRGISKHLKQPHRFIVMTELTRSWNPQPEDDIEKCPINDPQLLAFQGCFVRLRMFDPGWQRKRQVDDRLVCLDLDVIITGPLDDLFNRPEPFVILGGGNSVNPCPYNGSIMMLRPGHNEELWTSFSIEASKRIKFYEFPDDQGWIWNKIPHAATWPCGRKSGIYAFRKPGWPASDMLPPNARIVAFPGARRPSDFKHYEWVRQHWV